MYVHTHPRSKLRMTLYKETDIADREGLLETALELTTDSQPGCRR